MTHPLSFFQYLREGSLASLNEKLGKLIEVNILLPQLLPPPFNTQCKAIAFHANGLTIGVPHAGIAIQVRPHLPQLLSDLRKLPAFHSLVHVQCRIDLSALEYRVVTPPKKPFSYSHEVQTSAVRTLQNLSARFSEDDPLRQALLKLKKRMMRKEDE